MFHYLKTIAVLIYLSALLNPLISQATAATKRCIRDESGKTKTFSSLNEYQGSKFSFDPQHPGYMGNNVRFSFRSIDKLIKNSFISFDSDSIMGIDLERKGIRTVDAGSFLGLFCLHNLNLRFNNITTLPVGVFEGLSNLRVLNLQGNLFESVPSNGLAFLDLNSLLELNLARNKIRTLDKLSFMSLPQLDTLDVGFNKIRSIHPDAFANLTSLKILLLNDNYLAEINPESWTGLPGLEKLVLSNNYLTKFDTTYNFSFFKLQTLNLSGNQLTAFNVFGLRKHLPNVQVLDLHDNNWHCGQLEEIKHNLLDSKIGFVEPVNCSEVKNVSWKQPPDETTTDGSSSTVNVSAATSPRPDFEKELKVQNEQILESAKQNQRSLQEIRSASVYLFLLVVVVAILNCAAAAGFFKHVCDRLRGRRVPFSGINNVENEELLYRR